MTLDLRIENARVVEARATYDDPSRPPAGISHVLVGGVPVVEAGSVTGATPGAAIRA